MSITSPPQFPHHHAGATVATADWKSAVYTSLVQRNHTQHHNYQTLITNYRTLLHENVTQKSTLLQLRSENRTLLNRNAQLTDQLSFTTSNNNNNSSNSNNNNQSANDTTILLHKKMKEHEEKILHLQEELTETLKSKSESFEQQLKLSNELKEVNKLLHLQKRENSDLQSKYQAVLDTVTELEKSISVKTGAIDVLKRDIEALRHDLNTRDEQIQKLKDENRQMIERAISEKQKQVDAMNQVNELHRTVMIQKQQLALLQAKYQSQSNNNNSTSGNNSNNSNNVNNGSDESSQQQHMMDDTNNSDEMMMFANHLMNQMGQSSSSSSLSGRLSARSSSQSSSNNNNNNSIELRAPRQVLYRKTTESQINAVVYSEDSMMIATAHNDKTVKLWNSRTGTISSTLHGAGDAVVSVCISPGQRLVAGSSTDNICRIWNMSTSRVQYSLTGHTKKIYATDFTHDGKRLITGSHDRTIKIWELQYGNCEKTLLTCKSSVNDLECSPAGANPFFVSGHFDACARLWDLRSPYGLVHEYNTIHKQQITSVNFSRDGNVLLTNARDNLLQMIDIRTHKVMHTLFHDEYKNNVNQNKAVMSPCASYVIAGTSVAKNVCYMWDVSPRAVAMRAAQRTPMKAIVLDGGHRQAITGCAWSPDGAQIASVSIDKQLVVYQ